LTLSQNWRSSVSDKHSVVNNRFKTPLSRVANKVSGFAYRYIQNNLLECLNYEGIAEVLVSRDTLRFQVSRKSDCYPENFIQTIDPFRIVTIESNSKYSCNCNEFQYMGIPCRHICCIFCLSFDSSDSSVIPTLHNLVNVIDPFWLIEQPITTFSDNVSLVRLESRSLAVPQILTVDENKKRYLELVTNDEIVNKIANSAYLSNLVTKFYHDINSETTVPLLLDRSSVYSACQNSKQGSAVCYYGKK